MLLMILHENLSRSYRASPHTPDTGERRLPLLQPDKLVTYSTRKPKPAHLRQGY